ncbi:HAMP domain-containing histidine kinase [Ilyomonas limi]|uniref:histidine kinase n=1 Tax=Ilyomonas limi TaxID=2575867 RepID=A0A4U3L4N0_9BACT|nr:HAMP domain-containing sensor histidine kinase [Ilyomonas limi]TKK69284.1 HAMP domain-containing histidine kinase [Ilyomonas limi]
MKSFIQVIKDAAYRHGYLLLIAAWLYTISFVFTNYWSYSASPQKVKNSLENYISTQEQSFQSIITDSAYLHTIVNSRQGFNNEHLQSLPIGLFAYRLNNAGTQAQEIFWNTSQMAVDKNDLTKSDGNYVVKYQNGFFELLKRTVVINNRPYTIAGLIPLYWQYFIHNKYLRSQFASFGNIDKLYRLSSNDNALAIKNSNGATLFHIEPISNIQTEQTDAISVTLKLVTILLLLFFFSAIAKELYLRLSFYRGLLFLVSTLLLFRLFVYYSPFPFYLHTLSLFTPPADNLVIFKMSLGDLLLNLVLLFQVLSFIFFYRTKPNFIKPKQMQVVAVVCLAVQVLVTILFCDIVKSLIDNSNISFDVNNFFSLSIYTITGLFILAVFVLCFYHFSWLMVLPSLLAGFSLFRRLVITVAAGLLMLSFSIQSSTLSQKIVAIIWLSILLIMQEYRQSDKRVALIRSPFLLIWVMLFSFSVSALFVVLKKDYELVQRKNLATQLAEEIDPYSETGLKMATNGLKGDFLKANIARLYDEDENRAFKDSLINTNFSGYLSKYDTHIYTYDSTDQPLYNDDNIAYSTFYKLLHNLSVKQKSTDIPGLYFIDDKSSDFRYVYVKDITNAGSSLLGRLVISARPKPFKREAIYPELFRQPNAADDALAGTSYAIYQGRHLLDYYNDFPFTDTLRPSQIPILQFEQQKDRENNQLWYKSGNNKIVIIVSSNTAFAEFLTLFAALFTIIVLLLILLEVGSFILRARFEKKDFKKAVSLNIRNQVQITIIGISIFSFIVIGAVTINFFINQFNKATKAKLAKSVQIMVNEVQEAIQSNMLFDNFENLDNNSDLERRIIEIANLNNTDVNLYATNGDLQISTQPDIYNKQILSNKMHPTAFYHLHQLHNILFTQKEYIKHFSFESVYKPVKSDDGKVMAYLNIPYLNSQTEVNGEISNLLVTLIFSNAVIFVLAGIIALLLTHRITSSLALIGNKLKALHLGGKNEQITWHRKDEISVLVNEYNKMVRELEASAQALARSERAGAWQEMARQVAHEIKNPLTPMKLSIQYLQRAINNNAANVKELSQRVAETLVEQIDQLAKIAGDFSQFANINHVQPVHFNISEMLESLETLHESDSHVRITYIQPAQPCYIYADKSQINRLFTNLIKNAKEASSGEVAEVKIKQHSINKSVVITIADKGTGIPADKQAHIFEPNFTTKSSGTGLGLAICKGIVEKARGKIWFTTKEGIGTTFYVELPLSTNTLIAV